MLLRKLVKPFGGLMMALPLLCGSSASAQTQGPVARIATPVAAADVNLSYADIPPAANAFSCLSENCSPGVWFSIDYLLWWIKDAPAPGPLVTTGSLLDPIPGAIGQPGTRVILGDREIGNNAFNGLRLQAGTWIDAARSVGYEASGFTLERRRNFQTVASDAAGVPFLARPIFDVQANQEDIITLAVPGVLAGALSATSSTRFSGWDFNFAANGSDTGNFRADALFGFRAYYLSESLTVSDSVVALVDQGTAPESLRAGERMNSVDRFATSSNFYGGQFGGRLTWLSERWITTSTIKLALGVTDQLAQLDGFVTTRTPGAVIGSGFLVNPGNAGRYYSNDFSVIPEFNLDVGYRVSRLVTLRAGYTFLYWGDVVRPGDVVSRAINPGLVPGLSTFGTGPTAAPRATLNTSDFWVQGLNLGLEFRF